MIMAMMATLKKHDFIYRWPLMFIVKSSTSVELLYALFYCQIYKVISRISEVQCRLVLVAVMFASMTVGCFWPYDDGTDLLLRLYEACFSQ